MRKKNKRAAALWAQLDALYARLPKVACQGRCTIACHEVPLTLLEASRLHLATHRKPKTSRDGVCVYLQDGRCTAYAVRPLLCRVWGVTRALSCMHGCVPERWLPMPEFLEIAQAIERLGGPMLQTDWQGLTRDPGYSFLPLTVKRAPEVIEADEERTKDLRALHGGRILFAAYLKEGK